MSRPRVVFQQDPTTGRIVSNDVWFCLLGHRHPTRGDCVKCDKEYDMQDNNAPDDASRVKGEKVGDPDAKHRAAMEQPMVGNPQPGSFQPAEEEEGDNA